MVERDERHIKAMIRLIDDMLDVTRLQRGTLSILPKRFDIAELVARLVESFTHQAAAAECAMGLQSPPTLETELDEFRIEQVLTNLLTNAMRYGPGQPVELLVAEWNGGVRIDVRDHGRGIAQEDQQRIFNQFERVGDRGTSAGLGLGLYITRQIVEAHGGTIGVSSTLGAGSTFSVWLPKVAPRVEAA
jgi:signal transduction histidine kinase